MLLELPVTYNSLQNREIVEIQPSKLQYSLWCPDFHDFHYENTIQ